MNTDFDLNQVSCWFCNELVFDGEYDVQPWTFTKKFGDVICEKCKEERDETA